MRFRIAEPTDADEIAQIYAWYVQNTNITFDYLPLDKTHFEEKISSLLLDYPFLVVESTDGIIGYAYAATFRNKRAYQTTCELTIYLKHAQSKKGIGTTLYALLLELIRLQGYVTAIAAVTVPNAASDKLHERFGFKTVGLLSRIGYKFDTWLAVKLYELQLDATEHLLPDVIAFQTFQKQPICQETIQKYSNKL